MGSMQSVQSREARKQFFFEKKNRKTFAIIEFVLFQACCYRRQQRETKSYLLLFFKKELLAFSCFPHSIARSMRLSGVVASVVVLLPLAPCAAAEIALTPANTTIGLVTYALGVFARPGRFTAFTGTLRFNAAQATDCRIDLAVDVPSLDMGTAARTTMALGPAMLDAAHYKSLEYHGACGGAIATGQLTLRGVTRTLILAELRQGDVVSATGSLRRQDYGVSGLPGVIGGTIRIEFSVTLPASMAAAFALPGGAKAP